MINTIKDYAYATFYVAGALILIGLMFFMGLIVIIPALIYATYGLFKLRRKIREQTNEQIHYTTPDRDRAESHNDR